MIDVVALLSESWKLVYAIEQITNRIEQVREDGRALKVSSVVLLVLHNWKNDNSSFKDEPIPSLIPLTLGFPTLSMLLRMVAPSAGWKGS
jgi:hypothetical protein